MTIIAAAYNSPTDYAIGSDSQAVLNGARLLGVAKVWSWGRVLWGGAGSAAQVQRARRFLNERALPPQDRDGLLCILAELHEHLLARVAPPSGAEVADSRAVFVFVDRFGIVDMDGAGAVQEHPAWWALGSGAAEARGAMWARSAIMVGTGAPDPVHVVRLAVEAATALDVDCGGDVVVLSTYSAFGVR